MKIDLSHHSQHQHCIAFLTTLYMVIMTCSTVLGNKLILTPFGVLSAASLISPLWYILGDILTEVYGYRVGRRLFWSTIISQFIFALMCYFLIKFDSPSSYLNDQAAYELVLGNLLKFSVINFFGLTIAWHVNAKLLIKWKILFQGKYFWLRSIGSSGIGLTIYSLLTVSINAHSFAIQEDIFSIVLASCLLKIIYLIIFSYPATIIVGLLNRIEEIQPQITDHPSIKENLVFVKKVTKVKS